MPKRVGRPAVPRAPNERVSLSTRIRGSVYNRLIEAAALNDRPLGTEFEIRLEQTFAAEDDIFTPEARRIAIRLLGHYVVNGPTGVVRLLMTLPTSIQTPEEPDLSERVKRWAWMDRTLSGIFHELLAEVSDASDASGAHQALVEAMAASFRSHQILARWAGLTSDSEGLDQ